MIDDFGEEIPMSHKRQHADQVGTGVFFIGLALIWLTGFWWPGIMFVLGAMIIARTMAEGKPWQSATGAFWLIGIGLVFWLPGFLNLNVGSIWPVLLILLGAFMLFGGKYRPRIERYEDEKPKNDEAEDYV
jgi:hypothetical protein